MDGGPNKQFSYKPRAGLIECSLKNCKMTLYPQVNQTIAPKLVRHRCIVENVVLVAGLLLSAGHLRGRTKPFCGPDAVRGP